MVKQGRKAAIKYLAVLFLAMVLIADCGIAVSAKTESADKRGAVRIDFIGAGSPANPVHHCTQKDDGSDYTEWSYVYFGSYPQSEVTGDELTTAITGASYDANGDTWVNGIKYRRISKSDTNYNGYFGDSTYRYFKWERIKWRVLKNNGSMLFLAADKGLDCKDYHDSGGNVTWESSTIRTWLNRDFYQTAFSSNEQNAIVPQNVVNKDNPQYGTKGGNNTSDKVFLLSIEEVTNQDYGFCVNCNTMSMSRGTIASDYTDWSYVYFGSYPQSEVVGNELTTAVTGASYDANGDAWVNGIKYRRISKSDTNYNGYFGDSTYRYFKWERIKWRVLKNNGFTLFVVADKGLDCKDYHDPGGSVTWENCTLRNWLNNDFYQTAFSSNERNAIVQQDIVNEDNPEYGTGGGNNTKDNIYLLSIGDVTNQDYGFCENFATYSEGRCMKTSDYAHVRGALINDNWQDNCWWRLRSPGNDISNAAHVFVTGSVSLLGDDIAADMGTCIPALHINLSSDLWLQTDDETSGAGGIIPIIPTVSSPSSQSVKVGTSAAFSVSANGGNPNTYTYQWYYAESKTGTGERISGATSASYTISADRMTTALNGRYYYCVVSNGIYEVPSERARLTVQSNGSSTETHTPPTVSGLLEWYTAEAGTSLELTVTASGGNPSDYTYQWYYAASESETGTKINGAVSSKYTISASEMVLSINSRYYYCIVSNGSYNVESRRTRIFVHNATNPGLGTGGNGAQGVLKTQRIQAFSYTREYGSKAFFIQASTNGNGQLTYQSSNKKVAEVSSNGLVKIKGYGTAAVTILASQTSEYKAASKEIKIEVIPKKIALKKAGSPSSRRISIKWKKTKKIKGYELYISSSKNFKSNTFRRVFGQSKTNTALTGLKSGKKYYVKIRSYAKVGKKKYYSEWSKIKQVKIK